MKKQTMPINKYEIEGAIKKAANEMLRTYNLFKTRKPDGTTITQLENIKNDTIKICTKAETANLWYTMHYKESIPFYEHLMSSGEAVVRSINNRIRLKKSKLENL